MLGIQFLVVVLTKILDIVVCKEIEIFTCVQNQFVQLFYPGPGCTPLERTLSLL